MSTSDGSFTANVAALRTLNGELSTRQTEIQNEIDTIMAEVQGLPTKGLWSGSMYQSFLTEVQNYKAEHIDNIMETMTKFNEEINKTADKIEEMTNQVTNSYVG